MVPSLITVLLVDDHTIVREGLRVLLDLEPDITVVGEANDGREAVQKAAELQPNVILMDISMPQLNGPEATQRILQAHPNIRVIMLSAHMDDVSIQRVLDSGARGFMVKNTPRETLAQAIRDVHEGKTCFSPDIARRLHDSPAHASHAHANGNDAIMKQIARLTTREVEVLQLIAEGRANKQTADELGISIKTVEKHRQHVMEKLGIHDTASLTRYAIAAGIVDGGLPAGYRRNDSTDG
ncbi:MAG TPA: response regulator transcription factor [Verrucomicrobiales bacterium]|nr:response regulator transcription factor [Verrucomicrobiales bacterium]